MKSIPLIFFLTISLLFLNACGEKKEPQADESRPRVTLRLVLPSALAKESPRFKRFLGRVISLELRVSSKEGFSARHTFGPAQWDGVFLAGLDFPRSPTDVLTIEFRAWDRKPDGLPRSFAAVSGKKRVSAADVGTGQVAEVPLRLSLNVAAREY